MANIIEISHLTKSFGGAAVVDDVSLAVREGEFVTLLGPSGCGKTTTLRLIAGFEYPDVGTVLVGGEDVTDLPPYRRPVNTVFQDYALFPHMTVAQNVGYGLRIAGVARVDIARRVGEALRMVDLLDKIQAMPAELSGGQRQRVALARAIIRQPKVLLLDEPLSALDVKLREAMQVELKHLHNRLGITFLLVTHDQKEALVMSDRVLVMDAGRIVQAGRPADLYDRPASPYVADFLGSSNLLEATVAAIESDRIVAAARSARIAALSNGVRFQLGERVLVAVRPEKALLVALEADLPGHFNRLEGTVIENLFHGHTLRTGVDIGLAAPFVVDSQLQQALSQTQAPVPGIRVAVGIDPANVTLFPGERGR
jgi:putative spermidine/putrescine transport system ATP-binding protein/spermidine/putrescine transport system ATP-binding protein